jgi:hypothetical protein
VGVVQLDVAVSLPPKPVGVEDAHYIEASAAIVEEL